jgi:hypothetical protein
MLQSTLGNLPEFFVVATPSRDPTCSVAKETIQAAPANARPAITNATMCGTPPL